MRPRRPSRQLGRRAPALRRAAPARAARAALGPGRGHPGRGHAGRRRGALAVGRGALRERAARPARPAQLGSSRCRGRRRRRRGRGARGDGAAPARQTAGQGRPALADRPDQAVAGRALRASSSTGGAQGGEHAERAEDEVEQVVAGVDRQEAEDRLAAADRESPEGEADVEGAEPERVAARGVVGGEQAEHAGEDVQDVVPAVDGKGAEDLLDLAGRAKRGAVEEADDADHDERGADRGGVEAGWAGSVHRRRL